MFSWFCRSIEKLYDKKLDGSGLALFRIFYGLTLLAEIGQLYYFRHLVYDKIPYIAPAEVDFSFALVGWMIIVVFLVLGLFTRQVAIINYLFSLTFIGTIETYEYHMFYVYMGVNFLLIFLDVSRVNSLDRLRLKLKYSNTRVSYIPSQEVSVLNYYAVVLLAIGFVYFDSVFFKLTSHNWMHGIGMWLPASLPQVTHLDLSFVLDSKWLSLALGYITLVFETMFIFLFWKKRWRWPFFIVGVGLHVGIIIAFPIPWFGIGVSALYLLMVPVCTWRRISRWVAFKQPVLTFYYDEECPLCRRTKIILGHFDVFKAIEFKGAQTHAFNNPLFAGYAHDDLLSSIYSVTRKGKVLHGIDTYCFALKRIPAFFPLGILISIPGFYHIARRIYTRVADNRVVERCTEDTCGYVPPAFPASADAVKVFAEIRVKDLKVFFIAFATIVLVLLQLNVTYNSALMQQFKRKIGLQGSGAEKMIQRVSSPVRYVSKTFLGICSHPVFMDRHFDGYNHILAVEAIDKKGKAHWLPMIDKNGMPGLYIYSFNWVKWTFRVDGPGVIQQRVIDGVRDFGAFWAIHHGFKPQELRYNLFVKKVDVPKEWKEGFLESQIAHPWIKVGTMYWDANGVFVSDIPVIEGI